MVSAEVDRAEVEGTDLVPALVDIVSVRNAATGPHTSPASGAWT